MASSCPHAAVPTLPCLASGGPDSTIHSGGRCLGLGRPPRPPSQHCWGAWSSFHGLCSRDSRNKRGHWGRGHCTDITLRGSASEREACLAHSPKTALCDVIKQPPAGDHVAPACLALLPWSLETETSLRRGFGQGSGSLRQPSPRGLSGRVRAPCGPPPHTQVITRSLGSASHHHPVPLPPTAPAMPAQESLLRPCPPSCPLPVGLPNWSENHPDPPVHTQLREQAQEAFLSCPSRQSGGFLLTLQIHLLAFGERPAAPGTQCARGVVVLLPRLQGQSMPGPRRCGGAPGGGGGIAAWQGALGRDPAVPQGAVWESWVCPLGAWAGRQGGGAVGRRWGRG